jgi:hypothetical protein
MPIEYGVQDETYISDWFTFRLISARSASNFGLSSSQLFFALPLEASSFRSQAALRAARHLAVAFRMSLLSVTHSGANPLFPRTRNARSSAASAKSLAANISKEILERDVAKTFKSPCTRKISTESSNDACCCSIKSSCHTRLLQACNVKVAIHHRQQVALIVSVEGPRSTCLCAGSFGNPRAAGGTTQH